MTVLSPTEIAKRYKQLGRYVMVFSIERRFENMAHDVGSWWDKSNVPVHSQKSRDEVDFPFKYTCSIPVDVISTDTEYVYKADLLYFKKEDVDLKVDERSRCLNIVCDRKEEETEHKDVQWLVKERRFGVHKRVLRIPHDADAHSIQAAFHDGVLTITFDKTKSNLKPVEIKE